VALVTLNRPDKLDALDYALIARLMTVLDAAEEDDRVRAIVLTGAGERAFSSGADIACFAPSVRRGQAAALRELVRRGQRMTARIESFPKPIIAAVNGLAHGGGCEIAEAAPLARASAPSSARPRSISALRRRPAARSGLPRLIGRKRALRMILAAEPSARPRRIASASSTRWSRTKTCSTPPSRSRTGSPPSRRSQSRPVLAA
jgi:enoyl-CoA hydratase/carnithine racemase